MAACLSFISTLPVKQLLIINERMNKEKKCEKKKLDSVFLGNNTGEKKRFLLFIYFKGRKIKIFFYIEIQFCCNHGKNKAFCLSSFHRKINSHYINQVRRCSYVTVNFVARREEKSLSTYFYRKAFLLSQKKNCWLYKKI